MCRAVRVSLGRPRPCDPYCEVAGSQPLLARTGSLRPFRECPAGRPEAVTTRHHCAVEFRLRLGRRREKHRPGVGACVVHRVHRRDHLERCRSQLGCREIASRTRRRHGNCGCVIPQWRRRQAGAYPRTRRRDNLALQSRNRAPAIGLKLRLSMALALLRVHPAGCALGYSRPEAGISKFSNMTGKAFKQSELNFFHDEGYLRLNGILSKIRLRSIKKNILRELSRFRVWTSGKSVSSSLSDLPPFQQIAKLSSMVKIADLDEALGTPEIFSAIVGLTGRTPQSMQSSQLLLSLPHQGRWSLSSLNWHVDVASKPGGEIPGIQAFFLIDDVVPHGGATLALARSHRVAGEVARRLRGSLKIPADLETVLSASNTEIVEMSGRAGDVFLMDMRVLHTPSINSAKNIRMMATTRFDLRTAEAANPVSCSSAALPTSPRW